MANLVLVPGLICDAEVWKHQIQSLQSVAKIQVADHGLIDSIVPRKDMKERLAYYLDFLMAAKSQTAAA